MKYLEYVSNYLILTYIYICHTHHKRISQHNVSCSVWKIIVGLISSQHTLAVYSFLLGVIVVTRPEHEVASDCFLCST